MDFQTRIYRFLRPKSYSVVYPRSFVGQPLLYMSCAIASLGDGLFGFSQGIIATFQLQATFLNQFYGITISLEEMEQGTAHIPRLLPAIFIATLGIAAFFTSIASAYVLDYAGRRRSIQIGASFYLVASLIQIIATNFPVLVIGRAIQGVGAGILSSCVPVYLVEIAPADERGMFAAVEALCMGGGYALSAWAAGSFVLLVLSFVLPESPRWLIQNGFGAEALWTLADLHAAGDIEDKRTDDTCNSILDTLRLQRIRDCAQPNAIAPRWRNVFNYPRRTAIGFCVRMFSQLTGISAVLHFLPELLARTGLEIPRALFFTAVCALAYSVGPFPAIVVSDKVGRRGMLMVGSAGLAGALIFLGLMQHARGIIIGFCVYLFIHGGTWGPVPLLLSAELFPLWMRARGIAVSTASDWFFESVMLVTAPPLLRSLGGYYYLMLGGWCIISGLAVWCVSYEVKGMALEKVGTLFGDPQPPTDQLRQDDRVLLVRETGVQRGIPSKAQQVFGAGDGTEDGAEDGAEDGSEAGEIVRGRSAAGVEWTLADGIEMLGVRSTPVESLSVDSGPSTGPSCSSGTSVVESDAGEKEETPAETDGLLDEN
ncbi:general substrate transporter [Roridomyces roridus]|uniref:General substrate transporter n=1 Tax=Roridomyces roridus TaxID=1738132 RepID=A0AAD7BX37_9AGAR|nr:general substrate transporter [Roridomyces roridus]